MSQQASNLGASVRARLLQLARIRKEDFQLLLTRYANERLLHRLAVSTHVDQFVLKGAALFTVWSGEPHRMTRDIDFLGYGEQNEAHMQSVFADIIEVDVEDDGVDFDANSLSVGPIRSDQPYSGVRISLFAQVTTARLRLQVDVGFGDVITPNAKRIEFPPLLDFPAPKLLAYPRETVVAEKLEAMVKLGLANSRMKDFFDLIVLSRDFAFEGESVARAITATFARRGTPLPTALPVALTPAFTADRMKVTQWNAFLRKSGLPSPGDLPRVAAMIAQFVKKPLVAAAVGAPFATQWAPGGPWK